MNKKTWVTFVLNLVPVYAVAAYLPLDLQPTFLSCATLPPPYQTLLTQPLMTQAIENFYQRTAMIQVLAAKMNANKKTYTRTIRMFVDKNKQRNQPMVAASKHETQLVELAFITMNFKALPDEVKTKIVHSTTPFGKLLMQYRLRILTSDRTCFSVVCNPSLAKLMHCELKQTLYGRTNTLISADSQQWLAQVTEILADPKAL